MNQNQEELYSELFAYRVVLQDSYENESDIIRELKNYLRDQGFNSINIHNTLHEFYKTFGIEISIDTIKQACTNPMVNNMLGFMLTQDDFENSHEHQYDQINEVNNPNMLNDSQLINFLTQTMLNQHQNNI